MLKSCLAVGPVALASFAGALSASAHAASDAKGVWLNDTGRGAIEIKDCGGALCGHVVWVKDGADTKGCGKQIIGDARPAGSTRWDNGWIYSPEKKRRYDVELTPLGDDKLRVVGYAGVKLFSKTMIWKRAPGDLQRCSNLETAAKSEAHTTAPSTVPAPASVEIKTPDAKTPQTPTRTAAPMEVKAPEASSAGVKPAIVSNPGAKSENLPARPQPVAASEPSKSATVDTAKPDAKTGPSEGEPETAEADTGISDKKLSLGDIDVSKFLTKTRGGNCKLDLPWVKLEFGCE